MTPPHAPRPGAPDRRRGPRGYARTVQTVASRWARRTLARWVAVAIALTALAVGLIVSLPPRGDVAVLCSNNVESCRAVVDAFEERSDVDVDLVRLPTAEALNRLRGGAADPEFDVWIGGPADAYVQAADEGLLAPVPEAAEGSAVPAGLRDGEDRWTGVYGGVLAFCVRDDAGVDPRTWADLLDPRLAGQVIAPHPLLSGTAATMLWVTVQRTGGVDPAMAYLAAVDAQLLRYTNSGTGTASLIAEGTGQVGVTFAPYCEGEQAAGAPVHTVYPADGTGYEVGAVALLAGAEHAGARELVTFAASPEGQLQGSLASSQLPTTTALPDNLAARLARVPAPILTTDLRAAADAMPGVVRSWSELVRDGAN